MADGVYKETLSEFAKRMRESETPDTDTELGAYQNLDKVRKEKQGKTSLKSVKKIEQKIKKVKDPTLLRDIDEAMEGTGTFLKDTGGKAIDYLNKAYKATSLRPLVNKVIGQENVDKISKEYETNPLLHTLPTEALRGVGTGLGVAWTGIGALGNIGRLGWNTLTGDKEDVEDAKRKLLKLGTTDVLGKEAFTPLHKLPKESKERWIKASEELLADTLTHPLTYLSAGGGSGAKTFQTQATKLGAKLPEAQKVKFLKEANKLYAMHSGTPAFIKGMEGLTKKFGLSSPAKVLGEGSKYAGRQGVKLLGKEVIPRKALEGVTTPVERLVATSKNIIGHPAHENPNIQQSIRDAIRRYRLSPEQATQKDLGFLQAEFKKLGKDLSEGDLQSYLKLSDPGYDITAKAVAGTKPFVLGKGKQLKPYEYKPLRSGESVVYVKPNTEVGTGHQVLDKFFQKKGTEAIKSGAIEDVNFNPASRKYVPRVAQEELQEGMFKGLKLPGRRKGLGPDIKHRTEYGGSPWGGSVNVNGKEVQTAIGVPDDSYKIVSNYISNINKAGAKQEYLKDINKIAKQLGDKTLVEDLSRYAEGLNKSKDTMAVGKIWDWFTNRVRKSALQTPGYNVPNIIGDSILAAPSFKKGNLLKIKKAISKLNDTNIPDTEVLFTHPTTGQAMTKAKVRQLYERHMVDTLSGDPNQLAKVSSNAKSLRAMVGKASGDKLAEIKHTPLRSLENATDTAMSLGINKANQKISESWNKGLQQAKFIDNLMKGESGTRAAQDVFGAVMDYGAPNRLTDAAKKIMAFPAYPMMATGMLPTQLAKSPNTMLAPLRLSKALSTNEDAGDERLPQRTKQAGAFITPHTGSPLDVGMQNAVEGLTRESAAGDKVMPLRDPLTEVTSQYGSLLKGGPTEFKQQLTPALRLATETLTGTDAFGNKKTLEPTMNLFRSGDSLGETLKKYGVDLSVSKVQEPTLGLTLGETIPQPLRHLLSSEDIGMKLGFETRKGEADQAAKQMGPITGHPIRFLETGVPQMDVEKLNRIRALLKEENPKRRKKGESVKEFKARLKLQKLKEK